ncbi:hypothetical protein CF319_g7762 [Tilletia indica]|nr:hypothetical protein CF319_g7762 [Tilletia indica]
MSQTLISDLHQYAAQLYWPQAEDIEACDFETLLFEDSHSPGHEIIQLFSAYPPPSESQELRGVGPLGPASEFDLLSLARNHLRNHGVKEERLTRLASFVVPELAVLVLQKLRGGSRIDIINMVEDRHAQLFGRMIRPLSLSVAKSEKDSRRCRELEEHTSRVGLEASQRIQVAERSADKARADSASLLARLQQEYEEAGKAAVDAERMRLQQYYEEAGKTAVDAERTRLQQEYEEASQTAVDAERARLQQEYEEAAKAAVDAERARLQQQHEQEKRRLQEAHRNAIEEISARIRKELTTIDSTTEAWKETSSDRAVNRIPGIAQPVIHHSSWEPPPTWRTHDRYQYLRRIGGGSQGDVWLCEDLIHRRNVVVKASRCELHGIPPNTMLREINALRKSIHHNIVYLTDVLYSTTAVGIVLPACATDLRCVLSQSRPSLDAALGKYYLRQILSGLDFLHRKVSFYVSEDEIASALLTKECFQFTSRSEGSFILISSRTTFFYRRTIA